MALNASGAISLGGPISGESINLENAQPATATVSLNDVAVRSLAGVPTTNTTIIMPTDFYGKSNAFIFTLAAGTSINLRSAALTAGWPGSGAVQANINSGTTIQSSSTGGYALTIDGSWPGGVTLTNSGTIVGRGGQGGTGGAVPFPGGISGGGNGGTAILVSVPVTINNASGTISGGGGGGGGGSGRSCGRSGSAGGGGGGGGNGFGTQGPGGLFPGFPPSSGGPGAAGGLLSGGNGGGAASCPLGPGGPGGAGGSNAGAGTAGTPATIGGAGGGSGGNALSGNPLVTFPALGTIYGPRV
jgi:hypothetical protein